MIGVVQLSNVIQQQCVSQSIVMLKAPGVFLPQVEPYPTLASSFYESLQMFPQFDTQFDVETLNKPSQKSQNLLRNKSLQSDDKSY